MYLEAFSALLDVDTIHLGSFLSTLIQLWIYAAVFLKLCGVSSPRRFIIIALPDSAKDFYKFCAEKERSREKTIISDDRWQLINEQIEKDKQNNPSYLPVYAVQLAMLTGFRVGELAALRWDSITDDYIIVDKSEKYNRKTREYYIDKTKNKKIREYPITPEIRQLLNENL